MFKKGGRSIGSPPIPGREDLDAERENIGAQLRECHERLDSIRDSSVELNDKIYNNTSIINTMHTHMKRINSIIINIDPTDVNMSGYIDRLSRFNDNLMEVENRYNVETNVLAHSVYDNAIKVLDVLRERRILIEQLNALSVHTNLSDESDINRTGGRKTSSKYKKVKQSRRKKSSNRKSRNKKL